MDLGELGWGLRAAMSERADGDLHHPPARVAVLQRHGLTDCARHRQVHGAVVRVVERPGNLGDGDGLVCRGHGVPLMVYGADCPGLALVAPDALGLAHCGWRSLVGGIVPELIRCFTRISATEPKHFRALIGPGICPACYEVDAPVLGARNWPRVNPGRDATHGQLDLNAAIQADLQAEGIPPAQESGLCTRCDGRLHSRRRDGPDAVGGLLLWSVKGSQVVASKP